MKFVEIVQLKLDELYKQVKAITGKRETATKAQKDWKINISELGKLYYGLEVHLERGKRKVDEQGKPCTPTFSDSFSLGDLVEHVTGTKPINPAYQTKNAFAFFVGADGKGPVIETSYDAIGRTATQLLIMAGRIANLVGHDLTSKHRQQVADLLNTHDKTTASALKAIIVELAPPEPMETADAEEKVAEFDAAGNLSVIAAAMIRLYPGIMTELLTLAVPHLNTVTGKSVFQNTLKTLQAFSTAQSEKNERLFPTEMLDGWKQELMPKPVTVVTQAPVEEPAEADAETPETETAEVESREAVAA